MKHRLLQCLLLLTFSTSLIAQTAPDFTIIDSDGQTHSLYADYLDKGKTVMLKLFFVNCPPCNQIAPHIETLYQEWGAGVGDVEFLELSTLTSDTDAKVNGYKAQHGLTFPSAGGAGNSVEALEPYVLGQFGSFNSTPTFVVIAPDGMVNFDVFGFGTQGQLNALSEAFEATGATRDATTNIAILDHFKNDVKVSPNPFQEEATINIQTLSSGELTYQLFDILGNQIENKELGQATRGEHSFTYNYSDLRPGTYIVRVELDRMPIKSIKAIKR